MIAHYLVRRGNFKGAKGRDHLLFWYLQNAMWGRYSGSVESMLDKDLESLETLDGGLDRLVESCGSGAAAACASSRTISAARRFYPLLYLLTRVSGARDLVSGVELKASLLGKQSRLEVHHVFPKAQLYKLGMRKGEVNATRTSASLRPTRTRSSRTGSPRSTSPRWRARTRACSLRNGSRRTGIFGSSAPNASSSKPAACSSRTPRTRSSRPCTRSRLRTPHLRPGGLPRSPADSSPATIRRSRLSRPGSGCASRACHRARCGTSSPTRPGRRSRSWTSPGPTGCSAGSASR
jgi:hypothetical protein